MQTPLRFVQLTDLHLSDLRETASADALSWAVRRVNELSPDFVAVSGDTTTYGTAASLSAIQNELQQLAAPVLCTPGNADLRSGEVHWILENWKGSGRSHAMQDLLLLLPDTSNGSLAESERRWLHAERARYPQHPVCLITHYPLDSLATDSREWLSVWIRENLVELYVAGHTHRDRTRAVGAVREVVTRGLDPDKAIGGPPAIIEFQRSKEGAWTEKSHPWIPPVELLPADGIPNACVVGWSVPGDPVTALHETLEYGLSALEVRPEHSDYDSGRTSAVVAELRKADFFLAYHLPSLSWDTGLLGEEELGAHVAFACDIGVDSLTVHVPGATAEEMEQVAEPTDVWMEFEDAFDRLFGTLRPGTRIAIENVHNNPGVEARSPRRKFSTDIKPYLRWIDAVGKRLGPKGLEVGAHLDVGHARNNGGELDNLQPLGDWYSAVGRRVLSYHFHQVDSDPSTGKLSNHLDVASLFGPRISFAGFFHAWSNRTLARVPIFVEVRDAGGRRRTATRLKRLFESTGEPDLSSWEADLEDRLSEVLSTNVSGDVQ